MNPDSLHILGVNSAGFNTASAMLVNGVPVYAVEEERLVREKRTRRFPMAGIRACLATAGKKIDDLDAIAISWNPAVNLEAFNLPQSGRARYLGEILYNVPNHLLSLKSPNDVASTRQRIEFIDGKALDIHYVTHHQAHASAFFFSPYEEAVVLTVDAFGEKQCATISAGRGNKLKTLWSQEFPHSLGSFYAAFTEYCGFKPQSDEWKLMGASSYGNPKRYYDQLKSLIRFHPEAGFELDLSYFNHYQFHRPFLYTSKLTDLLGIPPNPQNKPPTEEYYDLSAAAQRVFEEIYFSLLTSAQKLSGLNSVVISGGAALNSVANGKVHEKTPFREVFVPPVPDDSGGSLGAAFYVNCQVLNRPREYVMESNYLGPGYDDSQIEAALNKYHLPIERLETPEAVAAELIRDGKIIAWFQGRLEFGDRALGNRSILADPRDLAMKDKVNATIKYREGFRPFAPAILAERMDEYFLNGTNAPFMEKVFIIRPEKRQIIPAVTHTDGSGRLQTVTAKQNPKFHSLISHFEKLTGVPVVLNTSFNLKGEAMVGSPEDAIRTFYTSGLQALILNSYILRK